MLDLRTFAGKASILGEPKGSMGEALLLSGGVGGSFGAFAK